eukprot:scaffold73855_cov63-Phaeocystis_antarctica.AAC.3
MAILVLVFIIECSLLSLRRQPAHQLHHDRHGGGGGTGERAEVLGDSGEELPWLVAGHCVVALRLVRMRERRLLLSECLHELCLLVYGGCPSAHEIQDLPLCDLQVELVGNATAVAIVFRRHHGRDDHGFQADAIGARLPEAENGVRLPVGLPRAVVRQSHSVDGGHRTADNIAPAVGGPSHGVFAHGCPHLLLTLPEFRRHFDEHRRREASSRAGLSSVTIALVRRSSREGMRSRIDEASASGTHPSR